MSVMKQVILCGLGAVGITFGTKLNDASNLDFRVLVDEGRLEKYLKNKPVFNNDEQNFNYILPTAKINADLIIISTKAQGLDSAILAIKNFVGENTRIISLINGISSEEIIQKAYPEAKILKSYFIGHSAIRNENSTIQDGVGEIVTEKDEVLETILKNANINFSYPEDIDYAMWLKFTFNLFSNQVSAILKMTFGELRENEFFIEFSKKIISEVKMIAQKKGIKNLENLESDAINSLSKMCPEGKTSMLQDILARRETEVDIFAGEIIRLGKLYGIATPYNQVLYDLIKIEEKKK